MCSVKKKHMPCPHCEKDIEIGTVTCPYCRVVLVSWGKWLASWLPDMLPLIIVLFAIIIVCLGITILMRIL